MNNGYLLDKNLSYKAKGLLRLMLELSKRGSLLHEGELVKYSKDGRESLRSGLKELEYSGYLSRKQIRDDNGKYLYREVKVYETSRAA